MNSLNEYTFQVIEAVRPEIHDDDVLDERYIKDLIHQQRHIWLKRDIEKGRHPSEVMIQDLGCVEIEPASAVECCDYQSECTVMRTKLELPTPISFGTRLGIEYTGPLDPSAPEFSTMTFKRSKFFGNGRFNRDGIAFNYRNNRGYLISKNPALPLLEKISIRMIAENPSDAAYFKHCSGDPCYTDDSPYPMPSSIWPFMKEYIVNMLLNKERIPNDTTNDGRKTVQGVQKSN
jgi:hypothetical protein